MAHECTGICNNMLRYKSCIALGNGIDAATSAGGATTFGCGAATFDAAHATTTGTGFQLLAAFWTTAASLAAHATTLGTGFQELAWLPCATTASLAGTYGRSIPATCGHDVSSMGKLPARFTARGSALALRRMVTTVRSFA